MNYQVELHSCLANCRASSLPILFVHILNRLESVPNVYSQQAQIVPTRYHLEQARIVSTRCTHSRPGLCPLGVLTAGPDCVHWVCLQVVPIMWHGLETLKSSFQEPGYCGPPSLQITRGDFSLGGCVTTSLTQWCVQMTPILLLIQRMDIKTPLQTTFMHVHI